MMGFWGTIGLVLAVVLIGAWFRDRRNKGSTFGDGLETRRHAQDARNDQNTFGGSGGFNGGAGGGAS